MNIDVDRATLLVVNAAHGLSLGLSVAVLADVIHWKVLRNRPWITAVCLIAMWLPFALSGIAVLRRTGNTCISIYLCWLFLTYAHQEKMRKQRARERYAAGR